MTPNNLRTLIISDNLGTLTNEEFQGLFRSVMKERDKRIEDLKTDLVNTLKALEELDVEVTNDYGDYIHSYDVIFENDF